MKNQRINPQIQKVKKSMVSAKTIIISFIFAICMIAISYLLLTATSLITKDFLQPIYPHSFKNTQLTKTNMKTSKYAKTQKNTINISEIMYQTKINLIENEKSSIYHYAEIQAYTASTTYAKIGNNAPLFKTDKISDTTYNNIWFILPPTYFVEIISMHNSELASVNYNGIKGFVQTSKLVQVTFTPKNPFLINATFSIPETYGTYLRSSPRSQNDENISFLLNAGTTEIRYIGEILGEKPTGGTSNKWYYCFYRLDETRFYSGYVYSENIVNLSTIQTNTETLEFPKYNSNETENPTTATIPQPMNNTVKWILIFLLTLPTILIFVLLIKKPKLHQEQVAYAEIAEEFHPEKETQTDSNTKTKTSKNKKIIKRLEHKTQSFKLVKSKKPKQIINSTSTSISKKTKVKDSQTQKPATNFFDKFFEIQNPPLYPDDDEPL